MLILLPHEVRSINTCSQPKPGFLQRRFVSFEGGRVEALGEPAVVFR